MYNIGFVEKLKGFLLNPTDTFNIVKEEALRDGLRYFVILLLIYSFLNAVVITATWNTMWGSMFSAYQNIPGFGTILGSAPALAVIAFFIMFFILGLIGVFISGGIIHLGVLLFGGKRGYGETVKAVIYGGTPCYILGWIPFIGLIFGVWAFILEILGVRELQDLSTGKAIGAVLVPLIIIGVIISIIIAAAVYFYVTNMMPTP